MTTVNLSSIIVPKEKRQASPNLNEIRFIGDRQMLSLVLGSCISTVLVGKGESYVLAANHIVIARPPEESRVATIGARQQIDIMMAVFEKHFKISRKNIRCLHLIGGGKKLEGSVYKINEDNIRQTREIIREMKIQTIFDDTGSYTVSKYSMAGRNISVFVENKFINEHLTFLIDLDRLFRLDPIILPRLPVSSLRPSREFEYLIDEKVIFMLTGQKLR
jgi:chemotaxis receptor (MCP) glutamine deamidase CheD